MTQRKCSKVLRVRVSESCNISSISLQPSRTAVVLPRSDPKGEGERERGVEGKRACQKVFMEHVR
jgi:hypothetical protein